MANAFEQIDWIGAEALTHLEDSLVITGMCAKDKSADFNVKPNGYTVGDTVPFKTRPEFYVDEFTTTVSAQPIGESKRSMEIEKHFDVSVSLTAKEMALDFEGFSEQVVKPAVYEIANSVDTYVATKILEGYGMYTSDTLCASAADLALARKAANAQQLGADRFAIVDDTLEATMLGATWFNQAQTRGGAGTDTLSSGLMGRVMGIDWYSSLNFPTPASAFTAGTFIGVTNNTTGTLNLIGDTELTVDTVTALKTLVAGDHIQVAGCKRPFRCTEVSADTSAVVSITLTNPINEIVPDNAAVTIIGATTAYTTHGAIFDGQSLAVAMPMLDAPGDKISTTVSANGVSIRIVQGYTMSTKTHTMSLDCLVGAFALDPRRITLLSDY